MKTAVDSSILLDVLGADPSFGARSRERLRTAYGAGSLVACEVVWAEVRAHFDSAEAFEGAMDALGVEYGPLSADSASLAGQLWQEHRRRQRTRKGRAGARQGDVLRRVIADFLVGAHALRQADALLARDRGFFKPHFKGLRLIEP